MCDYWADRYEERSPSERSCLEAPLEKEGIGLLGELPRNGGDAVLLHTDLHAGNVLAAERGPWLAIDPKPCVGDPACDATQHIFNGVFVEGADAGALASPMARLLDLDLDRILLWLFARAVGASPYRAGMAGLARTLYSLLTLAACSEELAADRTDAYGIDEAQLLVAAYWSLPQEGRPQ